MKKFVITGGENSGVTLTFRHIIKEKGKVWKSITESSNYLIREEEKCEGDVYPWSKPRLFYDRAFALQLKWENSLPGTNGVCVLGKSMLDIHAGYKVSQSRVPHSLNAYIEKCRYNEIFFLETLPEQLWNKNYGSYMHGLEHSGKVKSHYEDAGYVLQYIPYLSLKERLDMIILKIEQKL